MAGSRSMSSGMQDRLNLRVAPPSLTDFDDSDAVPAANAQALMQIQPAGLHKDVILISLLKGWCEANGKSTSKSQRLYKKMFRKFQEHQVISPAHIEALKQCNYDFLLKTLVSWSLSSSSDDAPDGGAVLPFTHFMPLPDHDHSSFFHQRYEEDFIQKEPIGEGGFGKVYKVQHKLDKEHYAIKKIKVTKRKSCSLQSMQREIKTLACLDHHNIVRYHQSWFGEEVQLLSQQRLMLGLGSFTDMGNGFEGEEDDEEEEEEEEEVEEEEEEGEEQEGTEKDEEDSFYEKSKNIYSCQENESISKLGSTSPIITELVETRSERHSQQTSMTVSMNPAETDPFDSNFTVSFEDERFDSGELVNKFFSQTSDNVDNIRPLAFNKKEEEFDGISDSLDSSGTSGSTIIFQNVDSDAKDCDEFNLPSLKEQNSSEFEFVRQSQRTEKHIGTSSKSDSYEKIKITATTKSKKIVKSTLIPVTSATAALLSTITSSLSSSTRIHNRIRTAPFHSQQPIRNGKFRRSISWDGQESSPEVESGYWPRSRPSFKRHYYLYIQMELCSSTLRTWLSERNEKISKTENPFDVGNEKEIQNFFGQILEGMNYIHGRFILHRDVTPKNIFLSDKDDGHPLVKIGDFGLAREDVLTEPKTPMRFRRDQDFDESSVDPCVSQTYTSGIGTETYAAPEQLDGTTYDNKSDMYSMGLILFELYHPFGTGMERHKCLQKLRKGNIPEELQKRWPVQHSAIQCLTRQDSQERPSASDLLSGDMFPSKDKIIESQADEIQRLRKLLAAKETEISQLKENKIPKT
eukprot:XP_003728812.1 PREDICTED: eukaryotic translation initiation factor 2-alpha kinase 1 [Strongylocentrotus purpuratus]